MTASPAPTEQALTTRNTSSALLALLEQHKGQIANALPRHMTPERMIRVALTAYTTTPGLWECDVRSIAACIVQASILGLEPNSVLGEAYLIPFKQKGGRKACQLIVGYQGLLKLVRHSGELLMVNAQPVHEKDDFDFEDGLDPYLRHKRAPGPPVERGPVVSYWAGAVLRGGGKQFTVMTKAEVEAHRRKYSKSPDSGPWSTEFDQMAMKTCLRKLAKFLPKSIERDQVSAAINIDERADTGLAQQFTVDVPLELHPVQEESPEDQPEVASQAQPQRSEFDHAAYISPQQAKRIQALFLQSGKTKDQLGILCAHFGIESTKDLTRDRYNEFCDKLMGPLP